MELTRAKYNERDNLDSDSLFLSSAWCARIAHKAYILPLCRAGQILITHGIIVYPLISSSCIRCSVSITYWSSPLGNISGPLDVTRRYEGKASYVSATIWKLSAALRSRVEGIAFATYLVVLH